MAVAIPTRVSADSIYDTAKAISSGKQVSTTLYSGDYEDYKIYVTGKGLLKLNVTAQMNASRIYVYDSDGNKISESEENYISGKSGFDGNSSWYEWNETVEKLKVEIKYLVNKGNYYIRFVNSGFDGNGKLTFTATYPSSTSTAKINYITINLPKGSTLSLGTDTTGSGTVTWKSSKTSVATVSSTGKVTAKAKGSTIITAKSGSSSKKIKIVVT